MTLNATPAIDQFAETVVQWQKRAGRHGLPWQGTRDPYRIWLSEIMLQQTQVSTVIGYYERFLGRFPTLQALAQATQDDVMPYWAGLGYYARARNLHRCAQELCTNWQGQFPRDVNEIMQLPGIGRSTAAAIAAFSYGERSPIMDGNVKRVFTRYFGIYGHPSVRATEQLLWKTAEKVVATAPASLDMAAYTQGLMDLGSSCCARSRPECAACPLNDHCYAHLNAKQHELPTPKQKKVSDERQCKMLILQNHESVLLEQRPSPGIWGGLWSLPQYDDVDGLNNACRNWGQSPIPAQKMAALLHTFSHFKLHIEPWHVRCTTPILSEPLSNQAWISISELEQTALPAPVKKILNGLFAKMPLDLA
ncbi:MAG TPA: A/G-specific adenine glycosylase [Eoetvoesiella sp.]